MWPTSSRFAANAVMAVMFISDREWWCKCTAPKLITVRQAAGRLGLLDGYMQCWRTTVCKCRNVSGALLRSVCGFHQTRLVHFRLALAIVSRSCQREYTELTQLKCSVNWIPNYCLPRSYSMGQIIKSVCVCQCVSVAYLCIPCEHSNGRISW